MMVTRRTPLVSSLLFALGAACVDKAGDTGSCEVTVYVDEDGDGYGGYGIVTCTPGDDDVARGGDCDDSDATRNPGASEICNDIDDNCNGTVDEGATDLQVGYADADDDGFGDPDGWTASCDPSVALVDNGDDCDDDDAATNPDASEICGDGVDNDCDDDASVCTFSGDVDARGATYTWLGQATNAQVGWPVIWAGDLDGDGAEDFAAAAPFTDVEGTLDGAVYVVESPLSSASDLSDAAVLVGEASHEYAGTMIAGPGDVNGDGYDDLLIASAGTIHDDDPTDSLWPGEINLVTGPVSESMSLADADAHRIGVLDNGEDVLGAVGDWDGDGVGDMACGAPFVSIAGDRDGVAYVILGSASEVPDLETAYLEMQGEAAGDYAGSLTFGLGDTDGDGLSDLYVSAYGEDTGGASAGAVYVVPGGTSGEAYALGDAPAKIIGEQAQDEIGGHPYNSGRSREVGDVNDDGYADLITGARIYPWDGEPQGSRVYLFYGPLSGVSSTSEAAAVFTGEDGEFPWADSEGADLNADGASDVIVGSPDSYFEDENPGVSGHTYVAFGPASGTYGPGDYDVSLSCGDGTALGWAQDGSADADGDGFNDLLVGDSGDDANGTDAGAVYLLLNAQI